MAGPVHLFAASGVVALATGLHSDIAGQEVAGDPDCPSAVAGSVAAADGGMGLPGITIVARWDREIGDAPVFPVRVTADVDGSFAVCPPGDAVSVVLWAELGDHTSESATVSLADPRSPVRLALAIETVPAARLLGIVRDGRTDRGVPAVSIALGDAQVGTTNGRGEFLLTGLLPGSYTLSIEHIGYARLEQQVELASGLTRDLDISLAPTPIAMEPIVVSTQRSRRLEIQGFYERRRWGEATGRGAYFTADYIERRRPLRMTHMLGDVPGVRVQCSGGGMFGCTIRMARSANCAQATVYLDGVRIGTRGGSLDEFVLPVEVGGVEVYRGPAELPGEFAGTDARCGVVVIWTK